MANYQIAYHPTTKVATIQASGAGLPGGTVNIGTFTHNSAGDQLEDTDNHVFFHHVREALYKRKASNPAQAGFWPNNITDMASIKIVTP